jgi:hypothetical protein
MSKWSKGVCGSVAVAVILAAGSFLWNHLALAEDDHDFLRASMKTQAALVELTTELATRHQLEDAAKARDLELCRMGKLTDPDLCGSAEVSAPPPAPTAAPEDPA